MSRYFTQLRHVILLHNEVYPLCLWYYLLLFIIKHVGNKQLWTIHDSLSVNIQFEILTTRNTFCRTWYLPHSRVPKSMAELCINFGDSAITEAKLHIFHCVCAKRLYFYYQSNIWRHLGVPRPRFPIRWRNFGDSAKRKGQIAYFSLRMRETAIFLLPVKHLTSPS